MALDRRAQDWLALRAEPTVREAGPHERRPARAGRIGFGTLACPDCDAPVMPLRAVSPASALACPYCGHYGAVRDFLTLGEPTRPARVAVRVVRRVRLGPRG
jgi:hypothetical protein